MSLRAQIIALFALTLVVTMAIASYLGQRIAARAVESALRDRTLEVARSIWTDLDLSTPRDFDQAKAADQLTAALRRHRGIHFAELAVRRPGKDDIVRIHFGRNGPEPSFVQEEYPFPAQSSARLVGEGESQSLEVILPVKDSFNHTFAAIRLETYLADLEKLIGAERRIFFVVTAVGALVVIAAFTLILGRMLARPMSRLAATMAAVESGALDWSEIPGAKRSDEIGTVARGLEAMLARIRNFNLELQEKIDAATADLAHKNHALAELNDLLVDARRDLTAKERLAALGQLSGTIAHELGNPLNAISGHVQLLARDPRWPSEVKDELRVVEGEVKRMTSIIRRFLDSARALTPAPEPVELAALLDEAVSLSLSAETRARIEVSRDVPAEMGPVTLDPALVRHVLTNFISNAVDAMPRGGQLRVAARREGELVALSVSDTGAGIQPEERKHIFEPFYTTKQRGKGTGLGLAICREISVALKGRIDVETQPGAGSTFTLFVPAARTAPA